MHTVHFGKFRPLLPLLVLWLGASVCQSGWGQEVATRSSLAIIPADAEPLELIDGEGIRAFRRGDVVWVRTTSSTEQIVLPRFAAPLKSLRLFDGAGQPLTEQSNSPALRFSPEPDTWSVRPGTPFHSDTVLEMQLDASARMMNELRPLAASADGAFWFPAHLAATFGSKLRYEPQPQKNTVGYWTNADDYAEWTFSLEQPGRFSVGILQGCGKGQGGSRARLAVHTAARAEANQDASAAIEFDVEETGHFQNFRWRNLGELSLPEAGPHTLRIGAINIRNAALMDVRAVHLVRLPD
jgi:hypothetical protein